jgi:hypothetical protein
VSLRGREGGSERKDGVKERERESEREETASFIGYGGCDWSILLRLAISLGCDVM